MLLGFARLPLLTLTSFTLVEITHRVYTVKFSSQNYSVSSISRENLVSICLVTKCYVNKALSNHDILQAIPKKSYFCTKVSLDEKRYFRIRNFHQLSDYSIFIT